VGGKGYRGIRKPIRIHRLPAADQFLDGRDAVVAQVDRHLRHHPVIGRPERVERLPSDVAAGDETVVATRADPPGEPIPTSYWSVKKYGSLS
jgi:hypothetical protein